MVSIAGATGYLGLTSAHGLATHGAAVAVTGLDDEACSGTAMRLFRGTEKMPSGIACDVSERGRIAALVDQALQHNGRIDALVCDAGIRGAVVPPGEGTDDAWFRVMQASLHSVAWMHGVMRGRIATSAPRS
ncbi:SDR family oxidoreductase [Paraburkholderia steynii]|uniref:SDR family oxidoreductase n=1 Tax=Paraburkholderia steynii TaxID=1245441 RepID=UPI003CC525A3